MKKRRDKQNEQDNFRFKSNCINITLNVSGINIADISRHNKEDQIICACKKSVE